MQVEITYLKDARILVEAKGKLDIYNADDYRDEVKKNIKYARELILDFSNISYVASIGLRVILELNKIMQEKGQTMKIKNVCPAVMDVFKITGFDNFLNIENDDNIEKSNLQN